MGKPTCTLYCRCAHTKILPEETKTAVLRGLTDAGASFESVPDLCEMSANRDPALSRLRDSGHMRIAACYPRAVKWLFAAAGSPLDDDATTILNMRTQEADAILAGLIAPAGDDAAAGETSS